MRAAALIVCAACAGTALPPAGPPFAVVDHGREPRTVVRFETEAGASDRVAVTYKARTTTRYENTVMEEGRVDVDLPGVRAVCALTATAVSPTGDAELRLVVEEAGVLDDVREPATRAISMRTASAISGARATWFRASSGELSSVEISPELQEVVRSGSIRFPREPVGVGARWTQTDAFEADEVHWQRTITIALRDRADDTVTLDITTELRAGDQALHAEPNATTRVTGGTGRGSGHLVVSLRGLAMRGKIDETRTVNVLVTRGHSRIEAAIMSEIFVSYDAP